MKQSKSINTSGSLVNFMYANNATAPVVGEGATVIMWSDRHAYEVMSVDADGKGCIIQKYNPKRIDNLGMSDMQTYEYKDLSGHDIHLRYRQNAWRIEGTEIVLNKEYKAKSNDAWNSPNIDDYKSFKDELVSKGVFDADSPGYKLVDGVTRIKKTWQKINIIFGVKDEHYDFTF